MVHIAGIGKSTLMSCVVYQILREFSSITGIGKQLCSLCVMCDIVGIGKGTICVLRGIADV